MPPVTLIDSIPAQDELELGDRVCVKSRHDGEILVCFRAYLPGKQFDKRKLGGFITEALNKATLAVQTSHPQPGETKKTRFSNAIRLAQTQTPWAQSLSEEAFFDLFSELIHARKQWKRENRGAVSAYRAETKPGKFLRAIDGLQAAITAKGLEVEQVPLDSEEETDST